MDHLWHFAMKAAIVSAAIIVTVWLTADIVAGQIEDSINRLVDRQIGRLTTKTRLDGRDLWPRIERTLDNAVAAKYDLPPEK
jgi:hypothetical protein